MWGVPARHGDVPSAYPKAFTEPDYEIHLRIPNGMTVTQDTLDRVGVKEPDELVLLLGWSLYGLKQAGILWHQLLRDTLLKIDFVQCIQDPCLFYKADEDGVAIVGVYVDDLLITGTTVERIDQFFTDIKVLDLKDLGIVERFLGMRIEWTNEGGYCIDQEQKIEGVIEKHCLAEANLVRVPIPEMQVIEGDNERLKEKDVGLHRVPTIKDFQSLVGSLLWVSRCTRPEITFAVHRVTRRSQAPTMQDYQLAKRIARYLKGTKGLKLHLREESEPQSPMRIVTFSDADFAADIEDGKSVSAGVQVVNGITVGWHCMKQAAVAQSTVEAEFVSAAVGGRESQGLKELYKELGQRVKSPVVLKIDNQAAVNQIENEASSASTKHVDGTKHVDVKLQFLRDYAKKKTVKPTHESTKKMVDDLLMKVLPAPRIQ
uniref:PREDICTED: similar to pol polyprotein putative n=1 Tax=Albugo laibachii Nc14 TaxID=890382 RepID=F0WBT9_9STRA|nr:PREDICTED: similar to pol polyprotein putative [Albugo laibachii Nc14]CCA20572.1 PREDICTED: similar to pol polyprotein putative [Albugo laibachii Nc14]|eukprot:CCA20572.1 PREDICTED: similar to pol polyprotein putative [Albugo laibachii Nc14]